jgi:hypothetical protein
MRGEEGKWMMVVEGKSGSSLSFIENQPTSRA